MREDILNHFRQTGTYTYAGLYADYFKSLPDDITQLGTLICTQAVNAVILRHGNLHANADLKYGDMTKFPWHRMRHEDDVFITAHAMIGELFRLDDRGIILDRDVADKITVSCRHVTVLMASVIKAKGTPCRCRAGFSDYAHGRKIIDHWYNQIWDEKRGRWINTDASLFLDENVTGFDQFDIPDDRIDWAADVWLDVRAGKKDGSKYVYVDGSGANSLEAIARQLIFDLHSLMNNELTYNFYPSFMYMDKFHRISEDVFQEMDDLARLLQSPDENFDKLVEIWNTNRRYRTINTPQINDWFHVNVDTKYL